jgi:hypothetical protein
MIDPTPQIMKIVKYLIKAPKNLEILDIVGINTKNIEITEWNYYLWFFQNFRLTKL